MTLFAVLGALTFAAKYVMAFLPNIEPVSLTLLVYGAVFGLRALYPAFIYVILEMGRIYQRIYLSQRIINQSQRKFMKRGTCFSQLASL